METSVWMDELKHTPRYPQLEKKAETDVLIVGGGIHGIVSAYLLSKAGKKVMLIEKDRLCSGDTGYTTAFVSYAIDKQLVSLAKTFGEKTAQKTWHSCQSAIDLLEEIITTEQIDCDFERTDLTMYAAKSQDMEDLEKEHQFAKKLGFETKLEPANAISIKNCGSLVIPQSAKFHPTKFLSALADIAVAQGATIYEQTTARKIHHGSIVILETDQAIISANQIIVATGTPINSPFFLQSKIKPTNTYVIGGTLEKDSIKPGLYIDTQSPYHYLRVDAGTTSDHFMLGGEDHSTGEQKETDTLFKNLSEHLHSHISKNAQVTHQWSGQILSSLDGLPYIGRHPFFHNEFVGTCFGGDGMPFGILAAKINTNLILGKQHESASLFRPGRLNGVGEMMKKGWAITKHMITGYLSGKDQNIDSLEPNEGMIITKNGKKLAVSKDQDGKVTIVSAVCTHMGCIVKWNKAQQSWDCPCHGSQFSKEGNVLRGPATIPLKLKN